MKNLFLVLLGFSILNAQDFKNLFDPNSIYFERGNFSVASFNSKKARQFNLNITIITK